MKRTTITVVLVLAVGAVVVFLMRPVPAGNGVPALPTPVAYNDRVVLDSPLTGSEVSSPLTIRGKARGTWYFEASFPVELKGANGSVLVIVPAQAQGDWMTTDWVPFEAVLNFTVTASAAGQGMLILHKDNPSGLPENDDFVSIPVTVAP